MNPVRDWFEFQKYKRRYRKIRLSAHRRWHRIYVWLIVVIYKIAKRVVQWAEPRVWREQPELFFPVVEDRYSRNGTYRSW